MQQFDVAGVGRAAVEHLGRPGHAAHDLGQRRVFHVAQAHAGLVVAQVGQEQVPQAGGAGLHFQRLDHVAGVVARVGVALPVAVGRQHQVVHEALHLCLQRLDAGRKAKVHVQAPYRPAVDRWSRTGRGLVSFHCKPAVARRSLAPVTCKTDAHATGPQTTLAARLHARPTNGLQFLVKGGLPRRRMVSISYYFYSNPSSTCG